MGDLAVVLVDDVARRRSARRAGAPAAASSCSVDHLAELARDGLPRRGRWRRSRQTAPIASVSALNAASGRWRPTVTADPPRVGLLGQPAVLLVVRLVVGRRALSQLAWAALIWFSLRRFGLACGPCRRSSPRLLEGLVERLSRSREHLACGGRPWCRRRSRTRPRPPWPRASCPSAASYRRVGDLASGCRARAAIAWRTSCRARPAAAPSGTTARSAATRGRSCPRRRRRRLSFGFLAANADGSSSIVHVVKSNWPRSPPRFLTTTWYAGTPAVFSAVSADCGDLAWRARSGVLSLAQSSSTSARRRPSVRSASRRSRSSSSARACAVGGAGRVAVAGVEHPHRRRGCRSCAACR